MIAAQTVDPVAASCDLVIVAGRRPDLLARTLASFGPNLFEALRFKGVYVNIDPFCGTDADGRACAALVRDHFPDARIFTPETAGFAAAVRRLWAATQADFVLHLEDDWLIHRPLAPAEVSALFGPQTGSATFFTDVKSRRGGAFQLARRRRVTDDGRRLRERFNCHTTSPCFMRGGFARQAAALMVDNLDPEAQFSEGINPALETFAAEWTCPFIFGPGETSLIEDIGRVWRETRGIAKIDRDGESIWVQR